MDFNRAIYLQGLLHGYGYPIAIDGVWGANSQRALDDFVDTHNIRRRPFGKISQQSLDLLRAPKRSQRSMRKMARKDFRTSTVPGLPHSTNTRQMNAFYGHPDNVKYSLVKIVPAYQLYYGGKAVSGITVHKLCASAFGAVFDEVLEVYGQEAIRELGLDRYSGTYNKRKIRGGRAWSTHAYGCAIDMYAAKNRLNMSFRESLFSHKEYDEWRAIWRKHGFVNLGEALNRDSMHYMWASI